MQFSVINFCCCVSASLIKCSVSLQPGCCHVSVAAQLVVIPICSGIFSHTHLISKICGCYNIVECSFTAKSRETFHQICNMQAGICNTRLFPLAQFGAFHKLKQWAHTSAWAWDKLWLTVVCRTWHCHHLQSACCKHIFLSLWPQILFLNTAFESYPHPNKVQILGCLKLG